jgi:IclR family pca regulon transcriptional regulator
MSLQLEPERGEKIVILERDRNPNFVQALERGLAVIRTFSREKPAQTLSEVAKATGLTRAAARRFLLTLEELGYVHYNESDRKFSLRPTVLSLGYAYLSSLSFTDIAQPHMETLVEQVHESCSAAVLDGTEIVYVARVPTKRIMAISLALGSRLPAFATSMGRVLLADLSPAALDNYFCKAELKPITPNTVCDPERLRTILAEVKVQGWALLDQELEEGLRSIAAPIRDRRGCVIASLNVSTHVSRVSKEQLLQDFLPLLLQTAQRISKELPPS